MGNMRRCNKLATFISESNGFRACDEHADTSLVPIEPEYGCRCDQPVFNFRNFGFANRTAYIESASILPIPAYMRNFIVNAEQEEDA